MPSSSVVVRVGARFQQSTRRVDGAGPHREQQCAEIAGRRTHVAVGAGREQRLDRRRVVLVRGPHQGCLSFPLLGVVDARAVCDQRVERGRIARARGRHQRRFALGQRRVGIGAAVEQQRRQDGVAVLGGEVQRRHAIAVACVDLGARVEQHLHELCVAMVDCPMQRRRAVGIGVVGIGALGEQRAGRSAVAVAERARQVAGRCHAGAGSARRSDQPAKEWEAHG